MHLMLRTDYGYIVIASTYIFSSNQLCDAQLKLTFIVWSNEYIFRFKDIFLKSIGENHPLVKLFNEKSSTIQSKDI